MLAGCSSSSGVVSSIYLLHLGYNDGTIYQASSLEIVSPDISIDLGNLVGKTQFEIRIGYFAMCMHTQPGPWLCAQNATVLAAQLDATQDPLNLLHAAASFRDKIVFPYLL